MGEIKDEAEKIEILKKSDVYAVGVLIHEILLNKAPKLWKNEHMRELDINVSWYDNRDDCVDDGYFRTRMENARW